MVVERAAGHSSEAGPEAGELRVGQRRPELVGHDQAGQRTHAVDAVRVAQRGPVGRLEIRPRLDRLAEIVLVGARVDAIGEHLPVRVHHA